MLEALTLITNMGWPLACALVATAAGIAVARAIKVSQREATKRAEAIARKDVEVATAPGRTTQLVQAKRSDY